ncbi:MAG TPA: carboxymuconolactone decarboxylase family protein [Gemmatimonadales bacterium]
MTTMQQQAAPDAGAVVIEPRMSNAATLVPEAYEGVQKMLMAISKGKLPAATLELTHMRISQINGCSACIEGSIRMIRKRGEQPDDRLYAVGAWHHSSLFTDAERAALELAEAMTRLADQPDAVPDAVWSHAAEHFTELELAALLLHIGLINLFNRLNVATRQPAGDW